MLPKCEKCGYTECVCKQLMNMISIMMEKVKSKEQEIAEIKSAIATIEKYAKS